ncbi:hypothetical protein B566_EDAN001098 [Ephemera danica]|nr:hypothetical protein B566_EDAN001098 [Ephemera danica]
MSLECIQQQLLPSTFAVMQLSSIVVVVGLVLGLVQAQDKYTTKWDNVDLDQILGNQRLRDNYVKCLLDQGSCTPDGSELKRVLPEALQTDCAKCNEKQKQGGEKTIRYFIKNDIKTYDI